MTLVVGGVAVGMVGALALTHLMGGLLFGVTPTDPLTLSVTVLVLLAAAGLASGVPAWKATRADPARILKTD
jgi:ABC-type antimicrobial peptide transport system permease subunit